MALMRIAVDQGASIYFFPEGTRNKPPKTLLEFHDGAFRLAIEKQLPLAILTILNAHEIMPAHRWVLTPGTIHATWSPPIETAGMTLEDLPHFKQQVRTIMITEIENFYSQ